jgi:hypothetical protein
MSQILRRLVFLRHTFEGSPHSLSFCISKAKAPLTNGIEE